MLNEDLALHAASLLINLQTYDQLVDFDNHLDSPVKDWTNADLDLTIKEALDHPDYEEEEEDDESDEWTVIVKFPFSTFHFTIPSKQSFEPHSFLLIYSSAIFLRQWRGSHSLVIVIWFAICFWIFQDLL